jgi:hypothetical protein
MHVPLATDEGHPRGVVAAWVRAGRVWAQEGVLQELGRRRPLHHIQTQTPLGQSPESK